MLTSDFDYQLPKSAIAQQPLAPRHDSRLMVLDRRTKTWEHRRFFEIGDYLRPGDLLVWNNSKVFKARLNGTIYLDEAAAGLDKPPAGCSDKILNAARPIEIFLLRPMENRSVWRALAKPGKKLRLGMKIKFADDFFCEVLLKEPDGSVLVQFEDDDLVVRAKANKYGQVPTPPYIKSAPSAERYQTIYAKDEGSVAAPTAGFHFTEELIEKLKAQGIEFAEITLHVGLGTFQPIKSELIEKHKMRAEWAELTAKNCDLINQARAAGRRVVAVGTTTTRTLEAVAEKFPSGGLRPFSGDIDLFIAPGFKFKIVDALITNFHLPKSTLLALVSAFADDREFILRAYAEALKENYRFYSFGDAMLIV